MAIELSTNIILEDASELSDQGKVSRFQLAYASQLYGTFFAVYARFNCDRVDTDKMRINRIDFLLFNYKGPLMMKILPEWEKPVFYPENADVDATRSLDIVMNVQANLDEEELVDAGTMIDGVNATTNQIGKLDPESKIVTMDLTSQNLAGDYVLKAGDYIRINRQLKSMAYGDTSKTTLRQMAFVNGHFDSEFYVRDGAYVMPLPGTAGGPMFRDQHITVLGAITRPLDGSFNAPGWRCPPADSKVVIGS